MRLRAALLMMACWGATTLVTSPASGQLYSENFDAAIDPNTWTNNVGGGTDGHRDFFFDYSSVGIPSAPNSTGGSTRGMKLQANLTSGIAGGISVSPVGKSFSGDYVLRFDLWSNYVGSDVAEGSDTDGIWDGAAGSTHFSNYGILSSGVGNNYQNGNISRSGVAEALFFANSGEGQQTFDYRVQGPGDPTPATPNASTHHGPGGFRGTAETTGTGYNIYNADRDAGVTFHDEYPSGAQAGLSNRGVDYDTATPANSDGLLYIEAFPSVAAPAAQVAAYPFSQHGTTMPGAMGMAWREVEIKKVGDVVTWSVLNAGATGDQDFLFATVVLSELEVPANSGTNIMFGHADFHSGLVSGPPQNEIEALQFTLIDNIRVETVVAPEDADFDNDGDVDGADFLTWQRGVETGATVSTNVTGDANNDGDVDGDDLAIWKGDFGTSTANAAPVPEPATWAMALIAGMACLAVAAPRRRAALVAVSK